MYLEKILEKNNDVLKLFFTRLTIIIYNNKYRNEKT